MPCLVIKETVPGKKKSEEWSGVAEETARRAVSMYIAQSAAIIGEYSGAKRRSFYLNSTLHSPLSTFFHVIFLYSLGVTPYFFLNESLK